MHNDYIPLSALLLDPNNYRLQEQDGFVMTEEPRFHLERVQNATALRMRSENLKPLRDSIVANGFLEIERIVVTPYTQQEGKFVVIEGNRRIAALQLIRDEVSNGIDIPDAVQNVLGAVPCIVANDDGNMPFFKETLMGIRHVGGIKSWGGFQAAKLISDMRDNYQLEAGIIAQRLGLSVVEVNRRYRAYKALQQMQLDEIYSENASAGLYPLFHEAVALPTIREWLDWSPETNTFANTANLEVFYQLITPRPKPDGTDKEAKLRTFSDVRALREIIPSTEAKADLLNLDHELSEALAILNQGKIARRWLNEVSEAKLALSKISHQDVQKLTPEEIAIIRSLIEAAEGVIQSHEKLNS